MYKSVSLAGLTASLHSPYTFLIRYLYIAYLGTSMHRHSKVLQTLKFPGRKITLEKVIFDFLLQCEVSFQQFYRPLFYFGSIWRNHFRKNMDDESLVSP